MSSFAVQLRLCSFILQKIGDEGGEMPTFGRIDAFEGGGDQWPAYVEQQVREFFTANDVPAEKNRAIFLSCCGSRTCALLRNLVKAKTLEAKLLEDILDILRKHYAPKPSAVVQRFRFNTQVRSEAESISDYIAVLKHLSEHCDYGEELDKMIRDRIVYGINNAAIQTRLLEIPDLTFEHAVQMALAMEAAKRDGEEIFQGGANASVLSTHSVHHANTRTCYLCGDTSHLAISVDMPILRVFIARKKVISPLCATRRSAKHRLKHT